MWAAVRAELRRPGFKGGRGNSPPVEVAGATGATTGTLTGLDRDFLTATADGIVFKGTFATGLPVDLMGAKALAAGVTPEITLPLETLDFVEGFAAEMFAATLGADLAGATIRFLTEAGGVALTVGFLADEWIAVLADGLIVGLDGTRIGAAAFLAGLTVLLTALMGALGFLTGAFTICLL